MGILILRNSGYTGQDQRDRLDQSTGVAGVNTKSVYYLELRRQQPRRQCRPTPRNLSCRGFRTRRRKILELKGKALEFAEAGGERAATLYSLIGSAKLNGLDPGPYLCTVLVRIADHPVNRIHE